MTASCPTWDLSQVTQASLLMPSQPVTLHFTWIPSSTDSLNYWTEALHKTAAKITGDLKADFMNLGARINTIEHKMEDTIAITN